MPDNPVLDAIHERRSIRKFTDRAVDREDVLAVLDAGRWAPSGLNNQPWRFLVVLEGDPRKQALEGCTKYAHVLRGAKALIAVMLDKGRMYNPVKDHQGAGACIQNMLLAAHSLGLGAVWLGEIINQEDQALEAMGLGHGEYELMAVLAVGHPEQKGASTRKPLEDLMLEPL